MWIHLQITAICTHSPETIHVGKPHQRNLQVLATELYKVKMGLAPQLVQEIFPLSTQAYNLRSSYEFKLESVKTVHYGTESLSFLGPKIWELVPSEIKSSRSLEAFKEKIKSWIPENCPCRLCKIYIHQICFLWKYFFFNYFILSVSTIIYYFNFFAPFSHQRL